MSEMSTASANLAPGTESVAELNRIAINSAQQIVDVYQVVRDQRYPVKESVPGMVDHELGFSIRDGFSEGLPMITLKTYFRPDTEHPGDASTSSIVAWIVSIHEPKNAQLTGLPGGYQVDAEQAINVTASVAKPNIPARVAVTRPHFDNLGYRGQEKDEAARSGDTVPTLADYARRSLESARSVMKLWSDIGFGIPEETTTEALLAAVDSPTNLNETREEWFEKTIGVPVRERIALAEAVRAIELASTGESDAATIITMTAHAQQQIIATGSLFVPVPQVS